MRSYLLLAVAMLAGNLAGAEFFVSPEGKASGAGSEGDPWNLATALAQPPMVKPGDTIWLRGGVYRGFFISRLTGSSAAPIIVRAYRDEQAVIDQAALDPQNRSALTVFGRFTWFWGLEFTNSEPSRVFPNSFDVCPNRQHCRPEAVTVFGPGTKVINCVIHDAGGGIGLWSSAPDSEAYGNIVFFVGWQGRNGGAGHSIYAQNRTGTSRITDNVLFASFHSGIHVYGSSDAFLRNFEIEGNTIFNTGLLGADPNGFGILVGGNARAENIRIARNLVYNPEWFRRSNNLNPSYGVGSTALVLEENYSVGFKALGSDVAPNGFRGNMNVFAGEIDVAFRGLVGGPGSSQVRSLAALRSGPDKVVIRRNRYEPNLATATVFNWRGSDPYGLDLSSFLKPGDVYEITDIQNWFAGPVVKGTYDGKPVAVPMQSGGARPVGTVPGTRYRTGAEFGVFRIRVVKPEPQAAPKLRASQQLLRFTHGRRGATQTRVLTLEPVVTGGATEEGTSGSWRLVSAPGWIRSSSAEGSLPDRVGFSAVDEGLEPGTHESEVVLGADDGSELVIPVLLTVLEGVRQPVVDLIVNRGSHAPVLSADAQFRIWGANLGPVDPVGAGPAGSPLPAELEGLRVLVNGRAAPLVEVSASEVIALPPPELAGFSGQVEVTISNRAGSVVVTGQYQPLSLGMIEAQDRPGLVRAEYVAGGMVAPAPSEEDPAVRPAQAGDVISVSLVGLPGATGETFSMPAGALSVRIGGQPAEVVEARRISAGLVLVTVVVPDAPEGRQPVWVEYNGARTQTGAYLPLVRQAQEQAQENAGSNHEVLPSL